MLPREYISKFCAVSDPRLWLTRPARDGHRLLASDGRIAIVTWHDDEVSTMDDSPLVGALAKLLEPIERRENWQPVTMALPPAIPCRFCGTVGKTTVCDHCEGEGVVEVKDGQHETCPACNGRAEWPDPNGGTCFACDGRGEGYQAVPVGDTFFQRRYLALLQSLAGPVMLSTDVVPSGVAFFRFTGGHGALMPCRGR